MMSTQRHTKRPGSTQRSRQQPQKSSEKPTVFASSVSPVKQPSSLGQTSDTSPTWIRARNFLSRHQHLLERIQQPSQSSQKQRGQSARHLQSLDDPETGSDSEQKDDWNQLKIAEEEEERKEREKEEEKRKEQDKAEEEKRRREEAAKLQEEEEICSLQEAIKEAMGELASVQEGNAELAETLNTIRQRCQQTRQERNEQEEERDRLRERLNEKQQQESQEKHELDQLQKDLKTLKSELEQLKNQEKHLHEEARDSEKFVRSKINEVSERSAENAASHQQRIQERQKVIESLNQQLSQLDTQLGSASAVAAEGARLKQRLKEENAWKGHKQLFKAVKEIMNEQNRLRNILQHIKSNRREEEEKFEKAKYHRDCIYQQLSVLVTAAQSAYDSSEANQIPDEIDLNEATALARGERLLEDTTTTQGLSRNGSITSEEADPSELLERLGGMLEYMDGTLTQELMGHQHQTQE